MKRAAPWGAFAEPLKVAHVRLDPGQHEIRIGDRKLTVRIGGKGESEGWETYSMHPTAARGIGCGNCHQTSERGGQTVIEAPKPFSNCMECHKATAFEAAHSHPLDPLKSCGSCHHLHGAPGKSLLKAPVKKLCADCHES